MKVAVLTTEYPSEQAPTTGSFAYYNAHALATTHEVTVIHIAPPGSASDNKKYLDGQVTVREYPNPMRSAEDIESARRLVSSLATGFDVLHSMNLWVTPALYSAAGYNDRLPRPWVHSEQWTVQTPPNWLETAPPVPEILAQTDAITFVADKLGASMRSRGEDKIFATVPLIVPVPAELPIREYQPGRLRLCSGGSISNRHQPELAVRTVKELRSRGIDTSLKWVGRGNYLARAQAKVTDFSLGEHIEFTTGESPQTYTQVVAESDMFIGPTKEEQFYLPAAKALLLGRPVLLGPGAISLDYISPEVCEIVVEQNSKSYANAAIALAERTANYSATQIAASVAGRFTPADVALAYSQLYERMFTAGSWRE